MLTRALAWCSRGVEGTARARGPGLLRST